MVVKSMRKFHIFLLFTMASSLSLFNLFAGSRSLFLRTPQFQQLMKRQLSLSSKRMAPIKPRSNPSSLLSRHKPLNQPKPLSYQTIIQVSQKRPFIPSVIAATLALFWSKDFLARSYNEILVKKAAEQIANGPWTPETASLFPNIATKHQFTEKGKQAKEQLLTLQQKAAPLYNTFKTHGAEQFIQQILTKRNDVMEKRFRNSDEFKNIFKKFTPQEKELLLATIDQQISTKENIIEELTTEPGWFWTKRPRDASQEEKRTIHEATEELKILKEIQDIANKS